MLCATQLILVRGWTNRKVIEELERRELKRKTYAYAIDKEEFGSGEELGAFDTAGFVLIWSPRGEERREKTYL